MSNRIYHVQPVGLSTMEVEADKVEYVEGGVVFIKNQEMVFFAPNVNTKYISMKNKSVIVKKS